MSALATGASLMFEAAARAAGLILTTWALMKLLRIRHPAHERLTWLWVLAVALALPLVAPLAAPIVLRSVTGAEQFSLGNAVPMLSRLLAVLWPLYIGGAGVLLLRVAVGLVMVERLWRTATPVSSLSTDSLHVRCSDRVTGPMATHAGVLLPNEWQHWSAEQRACVLAHERSHIERRDFHWQVLAHVYRALFWVSPLAWWHAHRLALLAEHLSDDAALARSGKPTRYAAVLLEFSIAHPNSMGAVGMARASDVSRRIERVLDVRCRTDAQVRRRAHVGAFLSIGAVLLAVLTTMGPWFRLDPHLAPSSELPALAPTLGRLGSLEAMSPIE